MLSVSTNSKYAEKFEALNQKLRWEVADELRIANLERVNQIHAAASVRDSFYTRHGKRVLDIAFSIVALVISLPINISLFFLTLIDLGRPVLFSQSRTGRAGAPFVITKLRTMREANDEHGRPLLGEKRVTELGRIIRRSSLDELLNFWSILKGDMSLIGPRPLVPEYLGRFSHRHSQRHALRPGLECPQREPLDHAPTYEEQFENDIWYVGNVSLLTDLSLMVRVARAALDRKQNKARGSSKRGSFMGYDQNGRVVTTNDLPHWALDKVLKRHGLLSEDGEPPNSSVSGSV